MSLSDYHVLRLQELSTQDDGEHFDELQAAAKFIEAQATLIEDLTEEE